MPELTSPLAMILPLLCQPRGYPHSCPEEGAGDVFLFFFFSELSLDVHPPDLPSGKDCCPTAGVQAADGSRLLQACVGCSGPLTR